jgi:hypothetical protein
MPMVLGGSAMSSVNSCKYRCGPVIRDTSEPYVRFFITKYHVYRRDRYPGRKGGTAVAVRKGIPTIM